MRKKIIAFIACLIFAFLFSKGMPVHAATEIKPMYRLYNPNSGEHFYTESVGEKNHLSSLGWRDEGICWNNVKKNDYFGAPVYRLYNPNAGDHHYTVNDNEVNKLVKAGWRNEGIGWYSAPEEYNGSYGIPVYRQYNPNAKTGSHNYTTSKAENDRLVKLGWRAEGIAWYGVNPNDIPTTAPKQNKSYVTVDGGVGCYSYHYKTGIRDAGADIYLIPLDGSAYNVDSKYFNYELDNYQVGKLYHTYTDHSGMYSINNVEPSDYILVIRSGQHWDDLSEKEQKEKDEKFLKMLSEDKHVLNPDAAKKIVYGDNILKMSYSSSEIHLQGLSRDTITTYFP